VRNKVLGVPGPQLPRTRLLEHSQVGQHTRLAVLIRQSPVLQNVTPDRVTACYLSGNTIRTMRWLILFLLGMPISISGAKVTARTTRETQYDLAWVRTFTSADKKNSDNKWDPRFRALIKQSFDQRQTFWRDHGRFLTLPELVMEFIGIPEGVSLEQDRFVTMAGCVPHACSARGMVWIDTKGTGRPLVLFVAPQDVSTEQTEKRALQHLWVFSSVELNWQKMPPQFEASFARWYRSYRATWAQYYQLDGVMVTLVEPSGLSYDLSPGLFALDRP
jgi:hypothetical protein